MILYHYTCGHAADRIDRFGFLEPRPQIQLGHPPPMLIWLTDMAAPDRETLGLTSHTLSCDRTERRYTVDVPGIAWLDWQMLHLPSGHVYDLAGDPTRWWVWPTRVRVLEGIDVSSRT